MIKGVKRIVVAGFIKNEEMMRESCRMHNGVARQRDEEGERI